MVNISRTKLKHILVTRIDSDDSLHKDVIKRIQDCQLCDRQAFIMERGYLLSCDNPSVLGRLRWKIGQLLTKLRIK